MKLTSIKYSQFEGRQQEWQVSDLRLGPINLLVGKNASGKTRILNVIGNLGNLLAGDIKPTFRSGNYDVTFDDDGKALRYKLIYRDAQVTKEEFAINGKTVMHRGPGGRGKILFEKTKRLVEFQTSPDELVAVARRDSVQHPFFEPLYKWGKAIRHFYFGGHMGREQLVVVAKDGKAEFNPKDTNKVIQIYRRGIKECGKKFKRAILQDMDAIDYPLNDIGVKPPTTIILSAPVAGEVISLFVKEKGLKVDTEQPEMSQGMFRTLSIIIQLNYSQLKATPSCILIDDIGEGLDFDRSCALIELLMRKVEKSSVQLIMATNDRFVMNKVPLEAWVVIRRTGANVQIFNYANSRKIFDEFKFTGLNNFDFFSTDFLGESHPDA